MIATFKSVEVWKSVYHMVSNERKTGQIVGAL